MTPARRGDGDPIDPGQLAERALALVPPGDGAQATVTRERSVLLRFARSRPTQATAIDDLTLEVTSIRAGHLGSATTNRVDDASLGDCARAAVAAAEAGARSGVGGGYPGLPAPAPGRAHDGRDPETARLDSQRGGAALATAFEAASRHGVEAHGVWTAAEVETKIASSTGVAAADHVTDAFMKVTCIAPDGRSGYAAATAGAVGRLDPLAIAERAAHKASGAFAVEGAAAPGREPGPPASLPPAEYPAVLESHAVGELLSWTGWLAFNGLAYVEERSALCGRLGTRIVAPQVNLSDSPRHPRTLPRSYDGEGVPKAPLPLIQDGVAHALVHDTRSAALAGGDARSTGHALAPGGASFGPAPTNLVLAGGGAPDEPALCEGIERGIYVTRLWYTNPVRPKETLLTGQTRDGTFLIEDGRVTRPLVDLRFTDAALAILARVEALTARSELTSEGEFYGRRFATGVVCPAARIGSIRFTDTAGD
jgi:predicted Zn-dependent protease